MVGRNYFREIKKHCTLKKKGKKSISLRVTINSYKFSLFDSCGCCIVIIELDLMSYAQCKINERIGIQEVSKEKMGYINVLL